MMAELPNLEKIFTQISFAKLKIISLKIFFANDGYVMDMFLTKI